MSLTVKNPTFIERDQNLLQALSSVELMNKTAFAGLCGFEIRRTPRAYRPRFHRQEWNRDRAERSRPRTQRGGISLADGNRAGHFTNLPKL